MQRDPKGYVDGMNLYAYVMNNPLRYLDPMGTTHTTMTQAQMQYSQNISSEREAMWNEVSDNISSTVDTISTRIEQNNAQMGRVMNGAGNIYDKVSSDIPIALQGGINGYRDVRDNAPTIPRYMLNIAMTGTELALTSGLSGTASMTYDIISGTSFDTTPTSMTGWLSKFTKEVYEEKSYISSEL
ncbi:hypothetical protein ADUPG1_001731 [Aduncisulcus paluster]|uniref:RHS repeat-associated core domain-containing protein n=1 Tax=Aduncisulcus paluster TaxID=2918883 RepID=A0ABQ5KEA5_9EUKA|nr:hypothetical protein ADUPG1_001731 [Aduncisulcus paluster]